MIRVDSLTGRLDVLVDEAEFAARVPSPRVSEEGVGTGRELFASMRAAVGRADEGAHVFGSLGHVWDKGDSARRRRPRARRPEDRATTEADRPTTQADQLRPSPPSAARPTSSTSPRSSRSSSWTRSSRRCRWRGRWCAAAYPSSRSRCAARPALAAIEAVASRGRGHGRRRGHGGDARAGAAGARTRARSSWSPRARRRGCSMPRWPAGCRCSRGPAR